MGENKKVTFRLADEYDAPFLQDQVNQQDVEKIDVRKCTTIVAEYDGKVIGMTSGQLVWLIEPQMVFNVEGLPKAVIRRAMRGMYGELDNLIQLTHPVKKQFCHIPKNFPNVQWAKKLGFTHIWEDLWTWLSKE